MALTFRKLHPHFVAEVGPIDLRRVHDAGDARRDPRGHGRVRRPRLPRPALHRRGAARLRPAPGRRSSTPSWASARCRRTGFGNEALGDISNLDENGEIMRSDNRRRMYGLGNRLWHTDASFQDPPGRYSMLSAKVVPPGGRGHRVRRHARRLRRAPRRDEGARSRGCACTTPSRTRARRSASSSPRTRQDALKGAIHPLVRTIPRSSRRSLYVASHASRIIDWPVPGGPPAAARPDRARHAARVRLPAPVARGRPRDLGQPRHHAPGAPVRRHEVPPGAPPGHHARHRAARRRRELRLSGPAARSSRFLSSPRA